MQSAGLRSDPYRKAKPTRLYYNLPPHPIGAKVYRKTENTKVVHQPGGGKRLSLALSGFREQKLASINEITSAILKLPPAHIAGLSEICYRPNGNALYPAFSRAQTCQGEFILETRQIILYSARDKAELIHMMLHEVGHYVFYNVIPVNLRYQWTHDVHPQAPFITQYAQTNASEDFAECYATYAQHPNKLKRLSKKYNFVQSHVFAH